MMRWAADLNRR